MSQYDIEVPKLDIEIPKLDIEFDRLEFAPADFPVYDFSLRIDAFDGNYKKRRKEATQSAVAIKSNKA